MEIHENTLLDDLKNQIEKADKYKEDLNVLNDKFYSILDEFKKYYIFFNKNPEVDEYQRMFSNIKDNIESINSQLFTINTNLQQTIDDINIKIQEVNVEIQKEKTKNIKLKNNVGIINDKKASSDIMIDNYKELYNNKYYFNVTILIGILIILILFYKYTS